MKMTEDEWRSCADPERMIDELSAEWVPRKYRLFACACVRRIWFYIHSPRWHHVIELAEQVADGLALESELIALVSHLRESHNPAVLAAEDASSADEDIDGAAGACAYHAAEAVANFAGRRGTSAWDSARRQERSAQAQLVRCVFGLSPLRPIEVPDSSLTPTAVSLAKNVYDNRDFERMPILADALEEAGCTNSDLLNHCRSDTPHARGCWVVDLILGKQSH
jgi:hypothetical protein